MGKLTSLLQLYTEARALVDQSRAPSLSGSLSPLQPSMSTSDAENVMAKASKLNGKGVMNKLREIVIEKGDGKLFAGDGIKAVRVMEPVQVAGGPLEVAGGPIETRVVMTAPLKVDALKVDVLSLSTAIAVGAFGGWLIVKAAGAVSRFFSGGNGGDGNPNN